MEDRRQGEIDLDSLLLEIKNVLSAAYRRLAQCVNFMWSNITVISLFSIAFGLVFWGIAYLRPPYYESVATYTHSRLNNDQCARMVNNLKYYLNQSEQNVGLAKVLAISIDDARKVREISYRPINVDLAKKYTDSTTVLLPFEIFVEVYDNDVLDTLQHALINYLESNEYAQTRKKLDEEFLIESEKRVEAEMTHIDSVKMIINRSIVPRATGNGIILGEPVDPINVSKRYMELYERKSAIARSRKLINSFEMMVGFAKNAKAAAPNKPLYFLIGAAVGCLIGMLFVLRRNKRKRLAMEKLNLIRSLKSEVPFDQVRK